MFPTFEPISDLYFFFTYNNKKLYNKKIKLSSSPSPLQNFANSVNELGKKKRKKNKEKEEQMKEKLRKFPQVGDSGGVGG